MEAVPINSQPPSDLQFDIDDQKTPNLPETDDEVTIAVLPVSKTFPLAPLTPSSELRGKRKRLKSAGFDFSSINKRSPLSDQAGDDPSGKHLRLGKEKATKDKAPVRITQTMIRAREIKSTLGNEYPSFIKTMLRSHVTCCFWMGLPLPFSRSFLPKHDSLMVIEDENGQRFNLKYLAHKSGLSAGWRRFAIRHKLHEGDVLIFQLVESCKFKAHIVRTNDSKDVDGDVKVINLDADSEHLTPDMVKLYAKPKGRKCSSSTSVPVTKVKRKYNRSKLPPGLSSHPMNHPVVNSQVQGSPTEPNLSLKDVKTFKDLHIMVNKQCIDSELSEEIRKDYYDLCVGKNEILHSGLREGLYYKLVAGVIGETVNIANMIRSCKLTTSKEEFTAWDSSLESFELIGMKVGFLRDRIRELTNIANESEDAKRYVEAKEEQNRNANEIRILEAKFVELYETKRKIDGVVDGLKDKAERYEVEFQKKVDEPL